MPIIDRKGTIALIFAIIYILIPTTTAAQETQSKQIVELKTVVIDAGHGGKDPGTISGKVQEKNITLAVAKLLGNKIKEQYPEIKVVYTRSTDKFVPLDERAAIANKNHADLFISIHVNATRSTSARGTETFVMGIDKSSSNMEVCQLENSVLTLEDGYNEKYSGFDPKNPESYIIFSLLQNAHLEQSLIIAEAVQNEFKKGPITHNRGVKQAPFLVLWKCTMPSILVELGFLSNPQDFKALTGKQSQVQFANAIFNAFKAYKKQYDKSIEISYEKEAPKEGKFRIQIMASGKLLDSNSKEFKGLQCEHVKVNGVYKYTYGRFVTREEASKELQNIKNLFPGAFIATF